MGDNFLEDQAKKFKKRRASATSNMMAPKLFQRSDSITDLFRIDCPEGTVVEPGEVVRCFPGSDGHGVAVVRAHERIGDVAEGGGDALRRLLRVDGMGHMRIRSFNPLTHTANAEVLTEVSHANE